MEIKEALIQQAITYQEEDGLFKMRSPKVKYLKFRIQQTSKINPSFFFQPEIVSTGQLAYFYCYRSELDDKVRSTLAQGGNLLLSGIPISGKSRMLFEALQQVEEPTTVFFAFLSDTNEDTEEEVTISGLKEQLKQNTGEQCYVCFEDVRNLASYSDLYYLVEELTHFPNTAILMGGQPDQLRGFPHLLEIIPHDPKLNFTHLEVKPLDKSVLEAVKQFVTVEETEIPLEDTKQSFADYYFNLPHDAHERLVLWCVKLIVFLTGESSIKRSVLVSFAGEKWKAEQAVKPQDLAVDLHAAIDDLLAAGAFYNRGGEQLYLPPAHFKLIAKGYLFHILKSNNIALSIKNKEEEIYLANEILEHYHSATSTLKNLVGNQLLKRAAGKHMLGDFLYEELKDEITIEQDTYHDLIAGSRKLERAEVWGERLASQGLKPTVDTLLSFRKFLTDWAALQKKEEALGLSHHHDSPSLLIAHLQLANSPKVVEEIIKRFDVATLAAIPNYYFHDLIKRAKGFPQGYEIYNLLPLDQIELDSYTYRSLIQLPGGDFDDAHLILLELQEKDIEFTDSSTLDALAKKAVQASQIEKVLQELMRLPAKEVDVKTFEYVKVRFERSIDTQNSLSKLLRNRDPLEAKHDLLLLDDTTTEKREQLLEELEKEEVAKIKTFELYLDHPSLSFTDGIALYNRMVKKNIFPSFLFIQILLDKYLKEKDNKEENESHILLLYQDIEEMLEFKDSKAFRPVFVQLIKIFPFFHHRVTLFELAMGVGIDIEPYLSHLTDLIDNRKGARMDVLRVLDILHANDTVPDREICNFLIKFYIPREGKAADLPMIFLFLQDLKHCGVSDEMLSRLCTILTRANVFNTPKIAGEPQKEESLLAEFVTDLRGVGIKVSNEVFFEKIFKEDVDQRYFTRKRVEDIVREYFPDKDINKQLLHNLVQRSSNYYTARPFYDELKQYCEDISLDTYKKLLEYALHARDPEAIHQVLKGAKEESFDYLKSLLSKLEKRNYYQPTVLQFLAEANLNKAEKKKIKYWSKRLAEIQNTSAQEHSTEKLLEWIKGADTLEELLKKHKAYKNRSEAEQLLLIRALLDKARPDQVMDIRQHCKDRNWNYRQPELVGDFLLNANDKLVVEEIYTKYEKTYRKKTKGGIPYYKVMIYPFYCLLSTPVDYHFAFKQYRKLAKAYPQMSTAIFSRLVYLLKREEEIVEFLRLKDKNKFQLSLQMIDHLLEIESLDRIWEALYNYRKTFTKKDLIYKELLKLHAKENKEWEDFKRLFTLDGSKQKHFLLTRFLLATTKELNEEVFSYYLHTGIDFPTFCKIFSLFEEYKIAFPLDEIIEEKVKKTRVIGKANNKVANREEEQRYHTLLLLTKQSTTFSKLLGKSMQGRKSKTKLFTKIINGAPTLNKKMELLYLILGQFSEVKPFPIKAENLLPLIDSIRNQVDFDEVSNILKEVEGKLDAKDQAQVNLQLSYKQLMLKQRKRKA